MEREDLLISQTKKYKLNGRVNEKNSFKGTEVPLEVFNQYYLKNGRVVKCEE